LSFSPTNLRKAQRRQHKVNGIKDLTNISAENFVNILGNSVCAWHHILAHFCQKPLPSEAPKIICAKAALLWCQKVCMKLRVELLA
jgi:hypothetical protein